jgi:hypothetical protein
VTGRPGVDVPDHRGRIGLDRSGRDLDRNPGVVVRGVELTSQGWHVLRRTTFDYRRRDGRGRASTASPQEPVTRPVSAQLDDGEVRSEQRQCVGHSGFCGAHGVLGHEVADGVCWELRSDRDAPRGGVAGEYELLYYGFNQPSFRWVDLPDGGSYAIDVIDTWNMTVERVADRASGRVGVDLPGRQSMAVRLTRVSLAP